MLVAIVGGILVASRGQPSTVGTEEPAAAVDAARPAPPVVDAAAQASAPDAAPIRRVTITVRSKPPGAEVIVGGVSRGIAPIDVEVPMGTAAILVEVRRDGRSTQQQVVPDRDRTVTLATRRSTTGTGGGSDLPF